ncbi:hypothetical protein WQ54_05695 [Bacillus sp. SA1-12]|uniref:hypothetical protein n=1 Tax=Bacillus sp. SA1-12 TaxID=1455638 RepID=UPI0006269309|nr:hypothetical protein [Bacillus sp. SA1-12]KKI93003.1 hypothetical protein WQ54_05695 [Bacillus sp. SA1-12]
MSILSKLSSQVGEKTEEGNRTAAKECLQHPSLLKEINEGLNTDNKALIGDCTEVFTKVAEEKPEYVAPYFEQLLPLLSSQTTRIRWEAIHAISLLTKHVPEQISAYLPFIHKLIRTDKSTIVRDYSIQTICNYADIGRPQALAAYPILKESLTLWEGKHRARILTGLLNVCKHAPDCILEIRGIAEEYKEDDRSSVKKAARILIKAIETGSV